MTSGDMTSLLFVVLITDTYGVNRGYKDNKLRSVYLFLRDECRR